jgi:hypothetical protein
MGAVIYPLSSVHSDERRAISEIAHPGFSPVRTTLLEVKGEAELGNRFHRTLEELFLVLPDDYPVMLAACDVHDDGASRSGKEVFVISSPIVVCMRLSSRTCSSSQDLRRSSVVQVAHSRRTISSVSSTPTSLYTGNHEGCRFSFMKDVLDLHRPSLLPTLRMILLASI